MRFLLDTNVLLRTAEPGHAQFRSSSDALELLREHGHTALIVPQVLYEFWSVATRPIENNGLGMTTAEAFRQVGVFHGLYRLLRDERAIYPIWEQLVTRLSVNGKTAHDSRLVAAMLRHSITHLLTYNTADFKRYSEITALSPVSVLDGADLV